VRDYVTEYYEPAAASSDAVRADGNRRARALAAWKRTVLADWPGIKITSIDAAGDAAHEGDRRDGAAQVELDGLRVDDVAVEVLHGPIDSSGSFIGLPRRVPLTHTGNGRFVGAYDVSAAGPYGLTVRALPAHPDLISPVELGIVAWAT
jgi:starch phosphorylase